MITLLYYVWYTIVILATNNKSGFEVSVHLGVMSPYNVVEWINPYLANGASSAIAMTGQWNKAHGKITGFSVAVYGMFEGPEDQDMPRSDVKLTTRPVETAGS